MNIDFTFLQGYMKLFFWGGCLYIYLSYGFFFHVCTSSSELGQRRSPPQPQMKVQKKLRSYHQVKPFIHLASLMVWCGIGGKSLFCHYLGWDTAHIAVLRLQFNLEFKSGFKLYQNQLRKPICLKIYSLIFNFILTDRVG